jgi:photosystem II stability/assembly factor-like uncharacterized protein
MLSQALCSDWRKLVTDEKGNNLAAISFQEGIYLSSNAGVNWQASKAPMVPWNSLSMSHDGKVLAATASKFGLFYSSDAGSSWKKVGIAGANDWNGIKVSSSGQYMFACTDEGVYRSEDFGANWMKALDVAGAWRAVSMDGTGKYGVVVGFSEGIYITSDFGKTWSVSEAPLFGWYDVTTDTTGKYCTAMTISDGIYTSDSYCTHWVKSSAPEMMWKSIASDSTGKHVVAAAADEGIYRSDDYGSSWMKTDASKASWISVSMSFDGSSMYGIQHKNDRMYESTDAGKSWDLVENKILKDYQELFAVKKEDILDMKHSNRVWAVSFGSKFFSFSFYRLLSFSFFPAFLVLFISCIRSYT